MDRINSIDFLLPLSCVFQNMIGAKEWTMPERATTLSGGGAWRDAEDIKIMSIYVFVEVLGGIVGFRSTRNTRYFKVRWIF